MQLCTAFFRLDLAKAFDSVPHSRLLLKLESLGIQGNLLSWFKSFLILNDLKELWLMVTFHNGYLLYLGVSQGSALDPLLFLLHIVELHQVIHRSTIKLFADNIALYTEIIILTDQSLLQEDLTKIFEWFELWQLQHLYLLQALPTQMQLFSERSTNTIQIFSSILGDSH